ncbi:manganese-dependent inorganic pyrophosphatase [Peptostreptococcus canis]|uniref:inorganic diphosphatase n=1 Tax=Peptostreptococcus canis TaxID=1159213 RepID=A0ABR6TIV3_9FIRM|nr:manganese-dependent inorganic pyrophosphatase [Peptostreptococcus canis]MBC2575332.1 manganese-dependent inorganic pyrophosphatase [Peptostreptococcus canis]MBP1997485.1 manganese-dependent inorganic pyrophosphatase [Peptostreptococcus canis]
MSLLVFGHKNPDTDSICSSLVMTNFKKSLGIDAVSCRLGELRKEAEFVLNYFGVEPPKMLKSVDENDKCCLVDHNEFGQSVDGLEKATIVDIVDHHKLGGMTTAAPLSMTLRPVGCTNTILYSMYKENNVEITKQIAGLMLSAILSDTLIFRSPTTTNDDIEAGKTLAEIAGVDYEKYGMEMFKAGTSLDGYTVEDIVNMDFKAFEMGSKKVGIGQVMTLDIDAVMSKKDDFLNYINESDYDMLYLAITDIINEGSYLLYKSPDEIVGNAFNVTPIQGVFVEGLVSRKKQLVPNLTPEVEKL